MLELPESYTVAEQLRNRALGRVVQNVWVNRSPHRFAFFFGEPEGYQGLLSGRRITGCRAAGGQVELELGEGRLVLSDGVNARWYDPGEDFGEKDQLCVEFEDFSHLICTVQMYGGLWAFLAGENDNFYYRVAREKPSPLTDAFDWDYFMGLARGCKPNLSVKALLATEQRIPGLGNGVLQDILFQAGMGPKRKLETLGEDDLKGLFRAVKSVLLDMTARGGRDTERDLFGCRGGYRSILSQRTWKEPCPRCGGEIARKAYLGGNVYFCAGCQGEW